MNNINLNNGTNYAVNKVERSSLVDLKQKHQQRQKELQEYNIKVQKELEEVKAIHKNNLKSLDRQLLIKDVIKDFDLDIKDEADVVNMITREDGIRNKPVIKVEDIKNRRKEINKEQVERIFINTIYLKCFKLGMLSVEDYIKRISLFK